MRYKILFYICIIFNIAFLSNSLASKIGTGPISSFNSVKEGYAKYLQELSQGSWTGVFAVSPDGSWGYGLYSGSAAWMEAQQSALENCNEYSANKSCKVFAKGKKIFWDWNEMPSLQIEQLKIIDEKSIQVRVGSGDIILSYYAKQNFDEYLDSCELARKDLDMGYYACFFAVSRNGVKSAYATPTNNYGGNIKNEAKRSALARCMQENNGKDCFLYADEKKIIWQY